MLLLRVYITSEYFSVFSFFPPVVFYHHPEKILLFYQLFLRQFFHNQTFFHETIFLQLNILSINFIKPLILLSILYLQNCMDLLFTGSRFSYKPLFIVSILLDEAASDKHSKKYSILLMKCWKFWSNQQKRTCTLALSS